MNFNHASVPLQERITENLVSKMTLVWWRIILLKLIVFSLPLISGDVNCSVSNLTALWFNDADSEPLRFAVNEGIELSDEVFRGRIQLFEDAFEFAIWNQSLPRLCENSVRIFNDLTVLQIRNCSLVTIDPGAFNVTPTLALLKISQNPITTLRRGVFNNLKVKEIDVSHNFISVIEDEAFDNMTYLEIVRLDYNAVKEISPNWFQNSPNVFKLNIIYNELTKIPSNAFQNLAKKRSLKLRLSANMLYEIDPNAFDNCGDIDMFRINGNKLREIPGSLFMNRTVKNLQLNTNRLLCLPDELYESNVRTLAFIENNYFNCSCLAKVRHFVETKNVDIWYPAIICEDREKEVNIVFNYNKTYEIPVLLPATEEALLLPFAGNT